MTALTTRALASKNCHAWSIHLLHLLLHSSPGARFDDGAGGDNEVQRTMLELINQLDGFDPRGNIKVLMATNRPDTLDPALMRPGRLDRKIEFGLPDLEVSCLCWCCWSFYVEFSALKQTHCALVTCDAKWVTVAFFTAHFEYPPKWCSCSAVSSYMAGAAQNCCHLCAFCVHHITMHRITGGTDTEIRVSTESWPWPRIFLRHSYRDLNPQPFDHKSSALTAELSPLPSSPLPSGVVVIKQGEVSFGITVTVWATRSPETSWKMCCSSIKLDSTPSPVLNPNPVLKPQALPRQST